MPIQFRDMALPLILALIWQVTAIIIQLDFLLHQPAVYFSSLDPDITLRLSIIRDLLQGIPWQQHTIFTINPPFGMESPWTRPVDALVLFLTAPFLVFTHNVDSSLALASLIYGPLLLLISISLLLWLAKRAEILSRNTGLFITFCFLSYPANLMYYATGNIDHHSLLATLWIALFCVASTFSTLEVKFRPSVWAGLIMGFGIWVSVEFQFASYIFFAWLGWLWLHTSQKQWLQHIISSATIAGLLTVLARLLEHPFNRFLQVEYDTVSIVHAITFLIIAIMGYAISHLSHPSHHLLKRFLLSTAIAGAALLGMLMLFPQFYLGPMANVDPEMRRIFLPQIQEMQPLLTRGLGVAYTLFSFAGLLCLWSVRKAIHFSPRLWLLLGGTLAFLILSLTTMRMTYYLGPVSIMLFVESFYYLWHAGDAFKKKRQELAFVAVAIFPIYMADYATNRGYDPEYFLPSHTETAEVKDNNPSCAKHLMTLLINGKFQAAVGEGKHTIITSPDWGPHIFWLSPYAVLASNYHRDAKGYLDLKTILNWKNPSKAIDILRERDTDILALCDTQRMKMPVLDVIRSQNPKWAELISELDVEDSHLHVYRINKAYLPPL